MTAPTTLHSAVDEILPGLVADRRHLHEHPELGMQEVETSRFVAERLAQLGVEDIRTGIANTGVTGLIRGTNPDGPGAGKVVLLRADMDALPMEEENDVEYRSQNPGVMHACGHDAHTAMLMGTARILMGMRDQFAGAVKLLFQPCEERPPGGAKFMIEQGVMENPTVTGAFAIHMANSLPVGVVGTRAGAQQAAADLFTITVQGKGGHGAAPHTTVDPVVVASQIVVALQTLVSRETDPLASVVVTVGTFNAGSAPNIIPDTASLRGTVRTLDQEIRERTADRMKTLVEGVAKSLGATATLDYEWGYPALVNDAGMAQLVLETAHEVVGPERTMVIPPSMPGEDMSYFLQQVPGCMFVVGSMNEDKGFVWGHHHPKFDIDEDSMATGVEMMTSVVLEYFRRG
ncbi:MAG TPA: amidohydrolase [Thermomicrobiales bacterium]|jgi:amidohydrolase|nr:amidohydrolase [Thermomicrobiales bacterium]